MTRHTALWVVQGVLAVMFLLAGGAKLLMSAEQMATPGAVQLPVAFIRFIGVCELLAAVGMIAPGVTGIMPGLTPIGAAGLLIIMIGATVVNLLSGMPGVAILTAVLGLLAAFVAYGRSRHLESSRSANW